MEIIVEKCKTKTEMYEQICEQLKDITEKGEDEIAILANTSALLNMFLDETNWIGFYLWKQDELVLGPFQGKPAVTHIQKGKGVCGTAVLEERIQRVDDVHRCCNHIACDVASSSEIVVPIWKNQTLYGVLDIDSPIAARFDEEDEKGLQKVTELLVSLMM